MKSVERTIYSWYNCLTRNDSSNSEHELLESCYSTSNGRMRNFGLIHRYDHDENTNSNTSDSSTSVEESQILSSRLQSPAETENDGSDYDGDSATEPITQGTSCCCTKKSTSREEGDYSTSMSSISRIEEGLLNSTYTSFASGSNAALNEVEATLPPMTPRS